MNHPPSVVLQHPPRRIVEVVELAVLHRLQKQKEEDGRENHHPRPLTKKRPDKFGRKKAHLDVRNNRNDSVGIYPTLDTRIGAYGRHVGEELEADPQKHAEAVLEAVLVRVEQGVDRAQNVV